MPMLLPTLCHPLPMLSDPLMVPTDPPPMLSLRTPTPIPHALTLARKLPEALIVLTGLGQIWAEVQSELCYLRLISFWHLATGVII